MKTNIPRPKYLEKIKPLINKQIIKVIVGQRRVGKSYLLRQVADYIKENFANANTIFVDKEKFEFQDIQNAKDLVDFVKSRIKPNSLNAIFIDEVQEITEFQRAVVDFFSSGYDIYISGSNSALLSGELATLLSGRYIEIRVYPLDYKEFLRFHNLPDSQESVNKYLRFGGMPYLRNIGLEEELAGEYLKTVLETILLKDIVKRFNVRQIDLLERLVLFLADNIGNFVSAKSIADFLKSQRLKISPSVVLNYLKYLSNAFLVNRVRRYDLQGKRFLEILEKHYFTDLGLRNSIVGYKPGDIDGILENAVFCKLISDGYQVSVGKYNGYEIDFIARKQSETIYFQVAYVLTDTLTIDREFGNLLRIKDNHPKYVISMDTVRFDSYKGIKHLRLWDFLKGERF